MPKRGDIVLVEWLDIATDQAGDPDDAALTVWTTPGYWHGYARRDGIRVLILDGARSADGDTDSQCGWTCIPAACVRKVTALAPVAV